MVHEKNVNYDCSTLFFSYFTYKNALISGNPYEIKRAKKTFSDMLLNAQAIIWDEMKYFYKHTDYDSAEIFRYRSFLHRFYLVYLQLNKGEPIEEADINTLSIFLDMVCERKYRYGVHEPTDDFDVRLLYMASIAIIEKNDETDSMFSVIKKALQNGLINYYVEENTTDDDCEWNVFVVEGMYISILNPDDTHCQSIKACTMRSDVSVEDKLDAITMNLMSKSELEDVYISEDLLVVALSDEYLSLLPIPTPPRYVVM